MMQMYTYYAAAHRVINLAHNMALLTNTTPSALHTTFTQANTPLGSTSKSSSGHNKTNHQTTLNRRVSVCKTG